MQQGNKKTLFAVCILLLLLGGAATVWWLKVNSWESEPIIGMAPQSTVPTAPSKPKAEAQNTPEHGNIAQEQPVLVPVVPTAGNLSKLTALKAQLEELKLQSQIDELQAKHNPTVVTQTAPLPLPPLANLPSSPSIEKQGKLPVTPTRKMAVISIQGIDDNITATIRTSSGNMITVRQGTKMGTATVVNISRQSGVTLRSGNQTSVLPFE